MKDCWQVLGIPPTTDADRVKRAYRALIKRYHPDTIPAASPELIRQYTLRCGRINQAFRQAIEQSASSSQRDRGTGPAHDESRARERWDEGAARWAATWRPSEHAAAESPRPADPRESGVASVAVTYLAPLLVIAAPLLILCFANMLWQMAHLFGGR